MRRAQHFGGRIETEKLRARIGLGDSNEIARGAAADFDHPLSGLGVQLPHQPVAPEEIIFAREIVEMPLAAVDLVHQRGMGRAIFPFPDVFQEAFRLA